ncbi:glycosyl hydrolase family 18 protein [Vibrio pectenicida]|uniref:GH18 domain-containing protein n=1 Tax=Vibrio pectenicida TaxID=62763 RepID=A0A3R9FK93_9VIBR|nr:glycosyl hydrolase family 18 protein [Vibrio pectenicida]RSD29990.1 hypothetical protein EJA03_16285 [Vibrio pectenicida]
MNKTASIITMAIGLVLSAQLMATDAKDSSSTPSKYSNLYHRNTELPLVTAYLSGAKKYSPEQLDELSKYDAILVSIDTFIHETESKANLPLEGRFLQGISERESLSRHSQEVDKEKGIMKRLEEVHKTKGTSIGITIALDAHAPDLIVNSQKKPVDHDLVIEVVKGYDFIHEINFDLKVQDIKNEMTRYKQFFDKLGDNLDREEISITVNAPKNVGEAKALHHLVDPLNPCRPISNLYINPRQKFSPTAKPITHHSNLYESQDDAWSTDKSLEFLIEDMQFDSKQLRLGYSNEVRNAQSLFKGKDQSNSTTKQSSIKKTNPKNKQVNKVIPHNPYSTIFSVSGTEGLKAKEDLGFSLVTIEEDNVDYVYDSKNRRFLSIETPRTVFVKARYANNKNLGGLFTHHKNNDGNQLLLNAAREGLGYEPRAYFFTMEPLFNSCGSLDDNICHQLTYLNTEPPAAVARIKAVNQFLDKLAYRTWVNLDSAMKAKELYADFKGTIPTTGEETGATIAIKAFSSIEFTTKQYEMIRDLHKFATNHNDDKLSQTTFKGLYNVASMSRAMSEIAQEYEELRIEQPELYKHTDYNSLKAQSNNPSDEARAAFNRTEVGKKLIERTLKLMNL